MKIRNIQIILLSLVALLCFSACSLEGDGTAAGDLAGMWKCVYIEKGAQSVELKDKKVFWSFQGSCCYWRIRRVLIAGFCTILIKKVIL